MRTNSAAHLKGETQKDLDHEAVRLRREQQYM